MQNLDMLVHESGFSSIESIKPHNHQGSGLHEFHYFLGGEGTFWNAEVPLPVKPGSLFLSAPDQTHRAAALPAKGRFRMYYLTFAVDESQGLVESLKRRWGGDSGEVGRGYAPAFEEIRRRCTSRDPLVRRSADFRFLALLCDLAGSVPLRANATGARYVEEALGLMQASIHTDLDLDALAERLGIDKSYFVRLFKQHLGVPPMRYFLGLRLDTAKHRLRNGDEGLRTIALDLGFHDEFHFSHQFKAHVGQSPQNFRQSPG